MSDLTLEGLHSRIEKLEADMRVVWPPDGPLAPEEREREQAEFDAAQRERQRVNRWWVTYNAALSKLASAGTCYAESVHTDCVHIADRAHGPLIKPLVADAGIAIDPKAWAHGRFTYTVDAQALQELIKAAAAATDAYNATLSPTPICQAAIDALEAALKPFEP